MKFRRRLSEPHGIMLENCPPEQQPFWLRNCWQRLTKTVTHKDFWTYVLELATVSSEPVVTRRGRNGQLSYTIYDPITQQQVDGLSETEARTWLEQRYYQ